MIRRGWRRRAALALAWWGAIGLLAWLDSSSSPLALRPGVPVQHAVVFGAIVAAIQIVGAWLGTAAAAVASYLAVVVQWLAVHLAIFIKATGVVFAKAWDGLKIVYADVLKPALKWFDTNIRRLYQWLHETFAPVFKWLNRVREELLKYYKQYVRPVLDTIDMVRAGLRVLGDLGLDWARELDRRLGQWESIITQNFARVLATVNGVIDALNGVLTKDGLFQRVPILRTLDRDAGYWVRMFWARQIGTRPSRYSEYDRTRDFPQHEPQEDVNMLSDELGHGVSGRSAVIRELGATLMLTARLQPEPFGRPPAPPGDDGTS
jgi:hypothetical protein